MDTLVIRLRATSAAEASWIVVDDAGHKVSDVGTGKLEHCAAMAGQRRIIVLVPGTDCVVTEVNLPVRGRARLKNAATFALEENLIDDVDSLHFAVGSRLADGRYRVAIVARERMQEWQDRIAEAGLNAVQILPESVGVPGAEGTLSILIEDNRVSLRDGMDSAVTLDAGDPREVLQATGLFDTAPGDDGQARPHVTLYLDERSSEENGPVLDQLRDFSASLDIRVLGDGVLAHMAHYAVAGNGGPNLLQGSFASTTDIEKLWRPWRAAAVTAAALVVVSLGAKVLELVQLSALEDRLDTIIAALYQDATGSTAPPGTEVRQFRILINQLGGNGEASDSRFLSTLTTLAAVVQPMAGVQAERISYRGDVLDLEITAPGVEELDTIEKKISEQPGLTAEIRSYNPQGDAVKGRIQIRAGIPQ